MSSRTQRQTDEMVLNRKTRNSLTISAPYLRVKTPNFVS